MVPSVPDTFRCPRQNLTLTKQGCGRLWQSAQRERPAPWEGRSHCRGCPIGAANAGQSDANVQTAAADDLRLICVRCQRGAERCVNGLFCVSCFNRDREATKGANRKGGTPRLCAVLHAERLATGAAVLEFPRVVDRTEALIRAAKQGGGATIAFGRAPLGLGAAVVFA